MFSSGSCILAFSRVKAFFCVPGLTVYLLLPEERKCLELSDCKHGGRKACCFLVQ